MSKHTPGPWIIEEPIRRGSWIGNKAGKWVCLTCGEENAQAAANARLIAAAPELLEFVKEYQLSAYPDTQHRIANLLKRIENV